MIDNCNRLARAKASSFMYVPSLLICWVYFSAYWAAAKRRGSFHHDDVKAITTAFDDCLFDLGGFRGCIIPMSPIVIFVSCVSHRLMLSGFTTLDDSRMVKGGRDVSRGG